MVNGKLGVLEFLIDQDVDLEVISKTAIIYARLNKHFHSCLRIPCKTRY